MKPTLLSALALAMLATLTILHPVQGGRPTSRALQQAVESPAEELILLDLSVLGPAAEGPAAELLLARGGRDRSWSGGSGSNWDNNRRDNNYNYNYDNNRRDNNYNYDYDNNRYTGGGTPVIVVAAPRPAPTGAIIVIDPWKIQSYPEKTAKVGDKIDFKWSGRHGVWKIPSGQCPSSFTVGNGLEEIIGATNDGSASYTFNTPGTYWFACPVSGHCDAGMVQKVIVV